jgi:hypothetical protein
MTKQQKSILVLAIITVFVSAAFSFPKLISAGELEPSAPPGPTMKTLDVTGATTHTYAFGINDSGDAGALKGDVI